jgi:hypothetical protein
MPHPSGGCLAPRSEKDLKMPVGPDGGLLVDAAWLLDAKLTSLPLLHLAKAIGCAVAAFMEQAPETH